MGSTKNQHVAPLATWVMATAMTLTTPRIANTIKVTAARQLFQAVWSRRNTAKSASVSTPKVKKTRTVQVYAVTSRTLGMATVTTITTTVGANMTGAIAVSQPTKIRN